jgi:hypothetical protein
VMSVVTCVGKASKASIALSMTSLHRASESFVEVATPRTATNLNKMPNHTLTCQSHRSLQTLIEHAEHAFEPPDHQTRLDCSQRTVATCERRCKKSDESSPCLRDIMHYIMQNRLYTSVPSLAPCFLEPPLHELRADSAENGAGG